MFITIAIDCGPLLPPVDGTVNVSGTVYGSVAYYSCNDNYLLIGLRTRLCSSYGTWTGTNPVCKSKGKVDTYNYPMTFFIIDQQIPTNAIATSLIVEFELSSVNDNDDGEDRPVPPTPINPGSISKRNTPETLLENLVSNLIFL